MVSCDMPAHYFLSVKIINCIDLGSTAELRQISLWISILWKFLGEIKMVGITSRIIAVKGDRS